MRIPDVSTLAVQLPLLRFANRALSGANLSNLGMSNVDCPLHTTIFIRRLISFWFQSNSFL